MYNSSSRTMLCGIQDYAVWYTGLCCVICRTMLYDMQDYAMWYTGLCRVSAGLCDMVYNTTLYGIQY